MESSSSRPPGDLPCDVALVIQQRCNECHGTIQREGAPLRLLTAADFQMDVGGQTAAQVALFRIQDPGRRMPPPPNPELTPVELATLKAWLGGGAMPAASGCAVVEAMPPGTGGSSAVSNAGGVTGTVPVTSSGSGGSTGVSSGAGGSVVIAGGAPNGGSLGAGGVANQGGAPPVGGATGVAGAAGAAGAGPVAANWATFGGDLAGSRSNPSSTLTASSLGSFHQVWQFQGPAVTSTPAVVDGVVYFAGWDGKVYAVHAADGSAVWTTTVPHLVDSSPAVTTDRVYVGDNNGLLHALDRTSGAIVWSKPAETVGSPHLWSSPTVIADANIVVVGVASAEESNAAGKAFTFRGSVVALDATTGDKKWQFYTTSNDANGGPGVGVWATATVDPALGLLYIGSGNAYASPAGPNSDALLAIRYATGTLEWAHQFQANDVFELYTASLGVDSDVGASANLFSAGGKDLVGVGVKNGTYYALDRKTGAMVWQRHVSSGSELGGVMGASAYANGAIYVAGNEGVAGNTTLLGINATDGSVLWTKSIVGTTYASLAQAGGVVYLSTTKGAIYAFDAASGMQRWTDMFPNGSAGGPSIGDHLVFAPWGFYFTLLNGTDKGQGGLIAYGP
jgi:polyvinyl alcohol dehydrogenase (cytochrome)